MTIQVTRLSDNNFKKAHEVRPRVEIMPSGDFRVASASKPGVRRIVRFDDNDFPASYTCTCAAFDCGSPCFHAAAAYNALSILIEANAWLMKAEGTPEKPSANPTKPQPDFSHALDCVNEIGTLSIHDSLDTAGTEAVARLAWQASRVLAAACEPRIVSGRKAAA
ncbi:MAG: hypothetical protein MSG64_19915 [Pyrinomonadaceae bacterium MAG19_C2-C3]|nr:hypothetical protein [Pyrinomonadaceae bacterium MAG19_C2-C3]